MAPDLNSLPPSRSPSANGTGSPLQSRVQQAAVDARQTPSPPPRSSSFSLAAAATINAGIQNQDSRHSSISSSRNRAGGTSPQMGRHERRRSVIMNLNLNDPAMPGPGEFQPTDSRSSVSSSFRNISPQVITGSPPFSFADPHHQRAPSLGEIHQEMEQEQEAQVNRLLQMIRHQQTQIQDLQRTYGIPPSPAVDDSTPTSERSFSFQVANSLNPAAPPRPRSPTTRASVEVTRQASRRSRGSSRTTSPALRPQSTSFSSHADGEPTWNLSGSGVVADPVHLQAENQSLVRDNQMLKQRIRELERQVNELTNSNASANHSPAVASNLSAPPMQDTPMQQTADAGAGDKEEGDVAAAAPSSSS